MPKRTKLDQDLKAVYGFAPSRVEDIDFAIFNYVNDSLNVEYVVPKKSFLRLYIGE